MTSGSGGERAPGAVTLFLFLLSALHLSNHRQPVTPRFPPSLPPSLPSRLLPLGMWCEGEGGGRAGGCVEADAGRRTGGVVGRPPAGPTSVGPPSSPPRSYFINKLIQRAHMDALGTRWLVHPGKSAGQGD